MAGDATGGQWMPEPLTTDGITADFYSDMKTKPTPAMLQALVEADLLDCVVALPDRLFYNTTIPACLWFLAKDKADSRFRKRQGETLFIDCRRVGKMISRKQRELDDDNINKLFRGCY